MLMLTNSDKYHWRLIALLAGNLYIILQVQPNVNTFSNFFWLFFHL